MGEAPEGKLRKRPCAGSAMLSSLSPQPLRRRWLGDQAERSGIATASDGSIVLRPENASRGAQQPQERLILASRKA